MATPSTDPLKVPYAQHLASGPCWAVLVDGDIDQVCGTRADALRERKDLIAMDCGKVTVRRFETWADAHAYEDKRRGY